MRSALRHPATWALAGVVLALALRAPWLHAAFGRDEGGVAYIALHWTRSGPFPYGHYFLDRPPLLVALYRVAELTGGATGIRVLGALASAVMLSSAATGSVFTPAELLAVAPSAASVLCLVAGIRRPGRRGRWLLAAAGALAVAALLVKQSFGDALAAGAVALLASAVLRAAPRRELLLRAAAYIGGGAAVVGALVAWQPDAESRVESLHYALFGFRLDAVHVLAGSKLGAHGDRLVHPALGSGLVVALLVAAVGLAAGRAPRVVRITVAGWLLAGLIGVLLGGSYWAHYLIELVPAATVGAAAAFVRWPRAGAVAALAVVVPAMAVTVQAVRIEQPEHYQRDAVAVGRYVRDRAEPGATMYVAYARTNVLYYAGLRDPYAFNWSLMMQAVPGVQQRLVSLLRSPQRPTWVVEWQPLHAFHLDSSDAITRLLARHYRSAGHVCGRRILLERGARARPAPAGLHCDVKT